MRYKHIAIENLMKINRLKLLERPTEIVRNSYLSDYLGVNLYIKYESRADSFGVGNKLRKLEYFLSDARAKGCNTLVVDGITQSNCCYAVAKYGQLLGFRVRLLYIGEPETFGNYSAALLCGAQVKHIKEWSLENVSKGIREIITEEESQGNSCYYIPTGGTSYLGVLGSINLGREISEQEDNMNLEFDFIVHPTGTGGTQLGISLAKYFLDKKWNHVPVGISNDESFFSELCINISKQLVNKFQFPDEILSLKHTAYMGCIGEGYMSVNKEDIKKILNYSCDFGVYFDSIYNYKTIKAIFKLIEQEYIPEGSDVLFIHSGGTNEQFVIGQKYSEIFNEIWRYSDCEHDR